ncbi:AAA family ATPase [bacterium]|nr:AAA family ATPase [bacterium]
MSTDNGFLRFQGTAGYIASQPLVDAVNCAIALERPLLLKGEPGTGKTVLARHVADGLSMPMLSWHIKSTSKAADGLYVYDTVQRLNDRGFGPLLPVLRRETGGRRGRCGLRPPRS